MDMVVVRFEKGFPDKVILVILSMSIKGCLTLELKGRMCIPDLLPLGMFKSMRVGVRPVGMVAIDVVKVAT